MWFSLGLTSRIRVSCSKAPLLPRIPVARVRIRSRECLFLFFFLFFWGGGEGCEVLGFRSRSRGV